jgi:hypothetical protein
MSALALEKAGNPRANDAGCGDRRQTGNSWRVLRGRGLKNQFPPFQMRSLESGRVVGPVIVSTETGVRA